MLFAGVLVEEARVPGRPAAEPGPGGPECRQSLKLPPRIRATVAAIMQNESVSAAEVSMTNWDQVNPVVVENHLCTMLNGRRLVGELDLSPDGEVFQMARRVFILITKDGNFSSLKHYPAVTAVFLSGEGGRSYDEGTFWPNIESLETTNIQGHSKVGKAFETAIRKLDLEDFSYSTEVDRWWRYVTPILLHGGIPASSSQDTANLVLSSVRNGLLDAAELIDYALSRPTKISQMSKPLQRFLSYGGELALDLVQRMIVAVLDADSIGIDCARESIPEIAEDLGLSNYLIEALVQALLEGGSLGKAIRSRRLARPQIRIDPYSCSGPYLVLPPIDKVGEWLLTGSSADRYKALRHDIHEVPLNPAREWTVTLRQDTVESRTQFKGCQDVAAYIFDLDGRFVREQRRIKGDGVLILVAKEVEVTCDEVTPIALTEEDLPPRSEPWQGWKLLSIDTSKVTAVYLNTRSTNKTTRLPVMRPPDGPIITSSPVVAVNGPLSCPVYARAPFVKEPRDTAASAWRVRWRDDNSGPPSSTPLDCLPSGHLGRDLAQRLPNCDAFWGAVEIVGPLGSDLHEHVAVVRDLHVSAPDRIVGPDETVEATVSADCVLTGSDGSTGRSVTAVFEPGCESIEVLANDLPLTITISRLSWTVKRRNGPSPAFSGEPQRIGLDEIESGEVESLMVRCGRSAMVTVELQGQETLQQAAPVRAAGIQGRWAFPLSQFRDTILASGLATMNLYLVADDTRTRAIDIVAHYEIAELQVQIHEIVGHEALLDARWHENRRFKNRQLKLWSQHRLWEPPVCVGIPDDADGYFCETLNILPGPYLAQIALLDDWITPRRPSPDSEDTFEVIVGSSEDVGLQLRMLRPAIPLEALELVVSGHQPYIQMDSQFTAIRSEMQRAIEMSCYYTNSTTTLGNLIRAASTTDGLLAKMLIDNLVWSLPSEPCLRLALALMILSVPCTADSDTLEMLWEAEPVIASVFDCTLDDDCSDRWKRFAGWIPDSDGPEQPSQPVSQPLDRWGPDRLNALADALPPMGSLSLEFGGYTLAALEMLRNTWPDRIRLNRWMSTHNRVITYTQRFSPEQHQQIDTLSPDRHSSGWYKFPARLLTAAFKITDDLAAHAERDAAILAILEAAKLAPLLTKRSLLVATGMRAASQI